MRKTTVLKHWKIILVNVGYSVSLTLIGSVFSNWIWEVKAFLITLGIVAAISLAFRIWSAPIEVKELQERLDHLKNANEDLSLTVTSLLEDILRMMVTVELKFQETDRVSIYLHNGDNEFIIAARYCRYVKWAKQITRQIYPDDQGVLGRIWKNGSYYLDALPDPDENFLEYLAVLNRNSVALSEEWQRKIRMKPRAYFGFKLMDDGYSKGIFLMESAHPQFNVTQNELNRWRNTSIVKMIEKALVLFEIYSPSSPIGGKNYGDHP